MRIQERSINMNLKKNDIIITKGKAFPLGVSCYSDNVQFSVLPMIVIRKADFYYTGKRIRKKQ